ncbi:MAG TPA: MBL fold metallo-hydrolase [bacterium]|nr:MBL fold metallo-hydrolase [bacterium]HOL47334.1 MBL fold metallo-hydrolase [bacterium]HPQ17960.1 MBL fold metallo-hydrolase [bacterium]
MDLISFGSSSSYNCSILNIANQTFIIDTGKIEPEFIQSYLLKSNLKNNKTLLITHAHYDHLSKNTFLISKILNIPIYIHPITFEVAIKKFNGVASTHPAELIYLYKNSELNFGKVEVKIIKVPHQGMGDDEAGYSVSYFFENKENENEKLFFGTDIGKINDEIQKYINEAEILFIETNYDKSLVEKSPRYYKHKNWLFSEKGHLSNDDTASAIRNGLIARSGRPYKKIILAHLSRTCNTPELAKNAVIREVKEFNQPKESILTAPAKDILILKNFDLFLN